MYQTEEKGEKCRSRQCRQSQTHFERGMWLNTTWLSGGNRWWRQMAQENDRLPPLFFRSLQLITIGRLCNRHRDREHLALMGSAPFTAVTHTWEKYLLMDVYFCLLGVLCVCVCVFYQRAWPGVPNVCLGECVCLCFVLGRLVRAFGVWSDTETSMLSKWWSKKRRFENDAPINTHTRTHTIIIIYWPQV